jgi:hypothetical protein
LERGCDRGGSERGHFYGRTSLGSLSAQTTGVGSTGLLGQGSNTTLNLPISVANQIPNATTATCVVRIRVYDYYNTSTLLSTRTVNLTVNLTAAYFAPSIAMFTASEAVEGILEQVGSYVQGQSRLAVAMAGTAQYGASISLYAVNLDGGLYNQASFTSNYLSGSGNMTLQATVTDTRGFTATQSIALVVLAYSPPRINAYSASRCDENGEAQADGEYVSVSLNAAVSPLDSHNTALFKVAYKSRDSGTWTEQALGSGVYTYNDVTVVDAGLDPNENYDFRFTAQDFFMAVSNDDIVPSQFIPYRLKAGGRAASFGMQPDDDVNDVLSLGMTIRAYKGLEIIGGSVSMGDSQAKQLALLFFPVGTCFHFASNTNPATLFGGVWAYVGTATVGSTTEYVFRRTS